MNTRRAKVYYNDTLAGVLEKIEGGYLFTYDKGYLANPEAVPISINFPLKAEPYYGERLFPFFKGLIPEGWLFELNARALKIDEHDDFAMLLATGMDCIGAISVIEEK